MQQFQPGDIVSLKSGSLKMTVSSVQEDEAFCVWFDKEQKPQAQRFKLAVLEK